MDKIYKLKKWLTLDDATKCIGSILNAPEFSKADLFQLALDERLKISVNLVNHAQARLGDVIHLSQNFKFLEDSKSENPLLTWLEAPNIHNGEIQTICTSQFLNNDKYVNFTKAINSIDGVWDLAMVGNEQIDLEFKFQQLTSGVEVTLTNIDGTFLISPDGKTAASLQIDRDDDPNLYGSRASAETQLRQKEFSVEEIRALRDRWSDAREKLKMRWGQGESSHYPAGGLDDDMVLVVRVKAIEEFEQSLMQPKPETEITSNAINQRLETTYLNIIGGLLSVITDKANPMPRTVSQDWIVQTLENTAQGLSKANLTKHFPKAKASYESTKKPN